ncbi:MAG: ribonuclease III [Chloroflexota bacterium]|nr:MAG: ribonuclease III [Chloroflexota bacterium]
MEVDQGIGETTSPDEVTRHLKGHFSDACLLNRALTHRSYLNEHPEALEDNERLEFLGDAVLDFLVGAWLYNRFPEMAEGSLTRLRAALVGNDQLAEFAREIGLGSVMRLGRGEEDSGGRDRTALLGSTFEALVGALYIDRGIPAVQEFAEPLLEAATKQILSDRKDQDPKSLLQEWAQSQGYGAPYYQTVLATGPDHDKVFDVEVLIQGRVYGRGAGHSKQAAAKAAARQVIESLGLE